jgi:malonate transporter and related proteins
VALFALGAMLARGPVAPAPAAPGTPARRPGWPDVAGLVGFKLVLHPLVVFATGRAAVAAGLPLDPLAAAVLVLIAALPSASNVPILAGRFGADTARLARVVLVGTIVAFATFTTAVAWIDAPARSPQAPPALPSAR